MRKINRFLINMGLFICIFLTSFSETKVTTVEALPKREKANLDIEVLKIKTDKITGVIYEKEKKIIFDFKDLKKAAEKKRIVRDTNNYDIFILESLDNAGTYMKKNEKSKMNKVLEQGVKLKNGEKIKLKNISYSLTGNSVNKVLEVSYEMKPETLYLAVLNNKSGMVENIYKAEFTLPKENFAVGSISDFSYVVNNDGNIIIESNHTGDFISSPINIRFEQRLNSGSEFFPIIALGNESIWRKENHNGGLPVEGSEESIKVEFNNSSITGKMKPQLKYKNSNPSGNIGQSRKIYFHNIKEDSSNKIAIGAYETSKNEFVEADLSIKIDALTIEEIKSYASNVSGVNGLVEIPYKNLGDSNQISLVIGSSSGNGFYDIPNKNLSNNKIILPYPKIYIRKNPDQYNNYFSYNINGLRDHIIDENEIEKFSDNFYIISLGRVSVLRKTSQSGIDLSPALGLGTQSSWEYVGGIYKWSNTTSMADFNEVPNVFLNIGERKSIYPYLKKISVGDNALLFQKKLKGEIGIDSGNRSVTLATYEKKSSQARLDAEIKIALSRNILESIQKYAYTKNEDIVEIPYDNNYKISLIPSSANNGNTQIYIPNTALGEIREIIYPKIKFKKNSGNQSSTGNFEYDYKLNNLEIGEKELIENNDLEKESGFVYFQQKSMISNDNQIPMIALGKKESAANGYLFQENTNLVNRTTYIANYNAKFKTYPYFKELKGGVLEGNSLIQGGAQKSGENSNLGIWVYSNNSREEVFAKLAIKIKNTDKKEILSYTRSVPEMNVSLQTDEKIAFVQGSYSSNKYKFPIDSDPSRIVERDYPNLTIKKDLIINNNIEIKFTNSYTKGDIINFDVAGNPNNQSVEVNLNSGQFINGLELNDGTLEVLDGTTLLASKEMNPSGDTTVAIQKFNLGMDIIYNNQGLASISLKNWVGNSHVLKIIHKEKSGLVRREYTVTLRTPGPTFEIVSKDTLDFGTVLKGDNTKTANSKIVLKNLSGMELTLTPITDSEGKVSLRNGDSEVKAGNFSVSSEQKESNNGNSYFILNGTLLETENSTLEGQHNGQFYLNVTLSDS